MNNTPTFHINRSRLLSDALTARGWQAAAPDAVADFAMWSSQEGGPREARWRLLDNDLAWQLDDKRLMHDTLTVSGTPDFAPPTFTTLPAYLEYLRVSGSACFCFLKTTHGTAAEGVFLCNGVGELIRQLKAVEGNAGTYVIQQGVRDVQLIRGRKFKIRAFVLLLSDWSAWVYRESLVVLHEKPYNPDSTDRDVHISPPDREGVERLSEQAFEPAIRDQLGEVAAKSIDCLREKNRTPDIQNRYQLFGYDLIMDRDGRLNLIEINAFPNLSRVDDTGLAVMRELMGDLADFVSETTAGKVPLQPTGFVRATA